MKTAVITGCLGFIGAYVTRACLSHGMYVYGIDSETYAANKYLLDSFKQSPNFTYAKADITTLDFLPDCDYVINLAAETHVGNSIINSDTFLRTNVLGVQNILNLIKNKPDNVSSRPTLIQFSTDEVYGDIKEGFHTETDPLCPSNPYSASKAAADMLILAWSRTYGIDYIILRPTNNYGAGQYPEKLIPLAVKLLQREQKIKLHNKGKPVRNWLHAADTARAVLLVMSSSVSNSVFNIAGNCEQTNRETVEKVINAYFRKTTNPEPFLDLTYVRDGQDMRYALSDEKIKSLGWCPKETFNGTIVGIVDYYKSNFRW